MSMVRRTTIGKAVASSVARRGGGAGTGGKTHGDGHETDGALGGVHGGGIALFLGLGEVAQALVGLLAAARVSGVKGVMMSWVGEEKRT